MRTLVLVCLLAAAAFADDAISTLTDDSSSVSSVIPSGSVSSASVLGDASAVESGIPSRLDLAGSQDSQDAEVPTDLKGALNDDVSYAESAEALATKADTGAAVSSSSKASSVDTSMDEESTITKKVPVVIMALLVPYPMSRADPSLSAQTVLRSNPYFPQPFYPMAYLNTPYERNAAQIPYMGLYDQASYVNPINPYSQGWTMNPYSQGANALPYYQRGFLPVSHSAAQGGYVVPQDYPYRIIPLAA